MKQQDDCGVVQMREKRHLGILPEVLVEMCGKCLGAPAHNAAPHPGPRKLEDDGWMNGRERRQSKNSG